MGGRRGQARRDIDGKDNCMLVCLKCHRRRHG
ncbi:MAG: HNH endonuclease [Gammaproteobacteria bacterium]|nr:HNH endonuclease [Gammaproteobacteria bacterium]